MQIARSIPRVLIAGALREGVKSANGSKHSWGPNCRGAFGGVEIVIIDEAVNIFKPSGGQKSQMARGIPPKLLGEESKS